VMNACISLFSFNSQLLMHVYLCLLSIVNELIHCLEYDCGVWEINCER
jgi:hypothetical protein